MGSLSHQVHELALRYFECLGSPRALTAAIMVRYGEWEQLATLHCDPRLYLSRDAYAVDVAASAFLKKLGDLPGDPHRRREAARAKWESGEEACFRSNERLSLYLEENDAFERSPDDMRITRFFRDVKKRILSWLGQGPRPDLLGRFGPGSTFADPAIRSTVADKMSSRPTLTRNAIWTLLDWGGSAWGKTSGIRKKDPLIVRGNRFSTAPKDAGEDRPIGVEPSLNVYNQLALGGEIKVLMLESTGQLIDMRRAQEVHRRVACESSLRLTFATLDLTNASETVCRVLVKLGFPRGWFAAFEELRSPFTLIGGKWRRLEKMSSMGNGFTFELETVLFAALCCEALKAAGLPHQLGNDVYVYGDDIIVPDDGARVVKAVLAFCGLQLNWKKSFFGTVPFRESCGGDFFSGSDVRPSYLKEQPHDPATWIQTANKIRRGAEKLPENIRSRLLRRAWFFALDQLPSHIRQCRGPSWLGDLVVHDDADRWQVKWRCDRKYLRAYMPIRYRDVAWKHFSPPVVLACALYGTGSGRRGIRARGPATGFAVGWTPFPSPIPQPSRITEMVTDFLSWKPGPWDVERRETPAPEGPSVFRIIRNGVAGDWRRYEVDRVPCATARGADHG